MAHTQEGSTVTREQAYRKGWQASLRTTTYDLDAAEDRFARRHGTKHLDAFTAGWIDYAADYEYGTAYTGQETP